MLSELAATPYPNRLVDRLLFVSPKAPSDTPKSNLFLEIHDAYVVLGRTSGENEKGKIRR
jgi:hypothetical protein